MAPHMLMNSSTRCLPTKANCYSQSFMAMSSACKNNIFYLDKLIKNKITKSLECWLQISLLYIVTVNVEHRKKSTVVTTETLVGCKST